MKKKLKSTLNVLILGTTLTLVSCGGGGGAGPTPPGGCGQAGASPSVNMGDMTVSCTDGACSLIKLQWVVSESAGSTVLPAKIQYVIRSNAATISTNTITPVTATSGFVMDGTSAPLTLGSAANTYYVDFTSTIPGCNGNTTTDTIRAATSLTK